MNCGREVLYDFSDFIEQCEPWHINMFRNHGNKLPPIIAIKTIKISTHKPVVLNIQNRLPNTI